MRILRHEKQSRAICGASKIWLRSTRPHVPRHLLLAVEKMRACAPLKEVLGEAFVETYLDAKEMEYEDYASVLSPWETKYLMLTV